MSNKDHGHRIIPRVRVTACELCCVLKYSGAANVEYGTRVGVKLPKPKPRTI